MNAEDTDWIESNVKDDENRDGCGIMVVDDKLDDNSFSNANNLLVKNKILTHMNKVLWGMKKNVRKFIRLDLGKNKSNIVKCMVIFFTNVWHNISLWFFFLDGVHNQKTFNIIKHIVFRILFHRRKKIKSFIYLLYILLIEWFRSI